MQAEEGKNLKKKIEYKPMTFKIGNNSKIQNRKW